MEMFHTNSIQSQMMETGTQNEVPYVGMPCTKSYYTDRQACTIVEVLNAKTIVVKDNKVVCKDYYAGDYEVLPELEGRIDTFSKRSNGRWVRLGDPSNNGLGLILGFHNHYIDPSF